MKNTIITILVIVVLGLGVYLICDKFIFNNNTKENESDINEDSTENNIENEVYGYLAINKENETKIIELNNNSKDRVIASHNGTTYSLTIKNNKLYYYFQNSSSSVPEKAMYIDLNNSNLQAIELISGDDVVDYYFDSNGEYLFAAYQKSGIKRYNLKTKEESVLVRDIGAYELFISNSKVYVKTLIFDENAPYVEKYYTIDFNGNNIEWISKEVFENASNFIGYTKPKGKYNEQYFIYNNKKIALSQDETQILYNDKIIYTSDNQRRINFKYTMENGKIGFVEYKFYDFHSLDPKYYIIDLKTNQLTEVSKNDLYDFQMLIK